MNRIIISKRENDEEHLVPYSSQKFTGPKQKFNTMEKECTGIIFAIKKLRHYLDGQMFDIETDHHLLVWLKNNVWNNPRLMRWSLNLQTFNYSIRHHPAKNIPQLDCLSRLD